MEQQDRVEQFKSEIADMRLRDPVSGRERVLLVIGVLLMVAGPIVALDRLRPVERHGQPAAAGRRPHRSPSSAWPLAIARRRACSCATRSGRFLRFWLARLSYEQQVQTDRVVAAWAQPPRRRAQRPLRRRQVGAGTGRARGTDPHLDLVLLRLAIVGAGGHGREVLDVVEAINRETPTFEVLGFVADHADDELAGPPRRRATWASVDDLDGRAHRRAWTVDVHLVLAIGDPATRDALASGSAAVGVVWAPALVHPLASLGVGRRARRRRGRGRRRPHHDQRARRPPTCRSTSTR